MKTTLNKIRSHSPCADGWAKLLKHLGKTQADDEPLSLLTILDSNGIDDAIWCFRGVDGYEKEIRSYGVWCARQAQHLMTDKRSLDALDVAERYARGDATDVELTAARAAAWAAAWDAQEQQLRKVLAEIEANLLAQPEQEHAEELAKLGWQYFECPACGSEGARAFPKPEQEPVAYMSHNKKNFVAADDVGNSVPNWTDYYPTPLYTTPPQHTEQNFCPRCGKRTNDIHTCTPPREKT